jgi:hypothetical protein
MGMSIVTIIVVLVAILIAWKVLTGVIKLGVIAAIVVAGFYLLSRGGL